MEVGGWGNWIEDVDGRDVDETTGVEETSIGQGLVGVTGRMGGVEGRGKDIGWLGCRNDMPRVSLWDKRIREYMFRCVVAKCYDEVDRRRECGSRTAVRYRRV